MGKRFERGQPVRRSDGADRVHLRVDVERRQPRRAPVEFGDALAELSPDLVERVRHYPLLTNPVSPRTVKGVLRSCVSLTNLRLGGIGAGDPGRPLSAPLCSFSSIGTGAMAKPVTVKIKLVSTADTGFYYVTKKNPRNQTEKMTFRKYDPVVRKHVDFKEAKIK